MRYLKKNGFIKTYSIFFIILILLLGFCFKLQYDLISLNERLLKSDLAILEKQDDLEDMRYYIHIMEKRFITLGGDVQEWGCKRTRIYNQENDDEDDDPSNNHVKLLSPDAMRKVYESKFNPNFDEPSKCIKEEMKIYPMKLMCAKLSYNYHEKFVDTSDIISSGLLNFKVVSQNSLFKEVLIDGLILAPSFGSSWGDFNGDGYMDLYVGNHYWYPSLFLNLNGSGGFRDVSMELLPESVNNKFLDKHSSAWADFDKDGHLDLLESTGALYGTASIPNNFYVFNNSTGKFKDESVERGIDYPLGRGRMTSWLDFDRDGHLDVFLSTQKRSDGQGQSALFRQDPVTHKFIDVTNQSGMNVDIKILFARQTDLDNDGILELFLVSFTFPYKIYHSPNNGKEFKDVTSLYFPFNHSVGESHREYSSNSTVWIPPPPESGFYALLSDLVFGDMDLNGYQDLIMARNYNGNCIITIMFNMGPPLDKNSKQLIHWETLDVFSDNITQCGSLSVADFDNDFNLDIFMVSYLPFSNSPNIYLSNRGDREFQVKLDGFGAGGTAFGKGESVSVADYDNDGYLDLFITNGKGGVPFDIGPSQLFRNLGSTLTKTPRYWIEIDLIGTRDNAHGFGSRIYLSACQNEQFRDVDNGIHFSSQNSFRVHFGLNHCPTITEIKVIWSATKKTQILKNIKPNQILKIKEN